MSLASRLEKSMNGNRSMRAQPLPKPSPSKVQGLRSEQYHELKTRIHDRLIDLMDLSVVDRLEEAELRREIAKLVQIILLEEFGQTPLNSVERDEVMGLGPLEPFLKEKSVTDILVHTHNKIYVERFGKLEETRSGSRTTSTCARSSTASSRGGPAHRRVLPMVDARLPDGSRVNAIIPPLAIDGPVLSIRASPWTRWSWRT
jgi:pilus assembly protein CpaF